MYKHLQQENGTQILLRIKVKEMFNKISFALVRSFKI